jgi:hypothetical protein
LGGFEKIIRKMWMNYEVSIQYKIVVKTEFTIEYNAPYFLAIHCIPKIVVLEQRIQAGCSSMYCS